MGTPSQELVSYLPYSQNLLIQNQTFFNEYILGPKPLLIQLEIFVVVHISVIGPRQLLCSAQC